MVKPLQRVAVSFPLSVVSLGALSAIIALQPPRTITGVLLSYLFPVVALGFCCPFVMAFSRYFGVSKHPITRFAIPRDWRIILTGLFNLAGRSDRSACSSRHMNLREPSNPSLQATAGRSDASIKIMKTHPLQSALAPASRR